jgi:hypothetical protein
VDNLVEILIGAKDTATPDLDALKARLDELGRKVETAKVEVDGDKESEAELLRINAQLKRLGAVTSKPKISVQGAARAGADILTTELRLDHLRDKFDKDSVTGGMFGRLFGKLREGLTMANDKIGTMLGHIPWIGSAFESMGGVASGVLIAIALDAALALGPLIAGLTLVTAGFGTLAAAAIPDIKKIWDAVTKGGAAGKKAWDALTPDEKQIGDGLKSVKSAFGQIEKAVQPEVIRAFGEALKIVKNVLPSLKPLAVDAGKALDAFLGDIDKWLNSPSGKRFIQWMQVEGPKAIKTFGHAMTDIVHGIGIVMYWWDRLGNDFVHWTKDGFDAVTHANGNVAHALGNTGHAIGNLIHAVGNVIHAFGNVVHAGGNVVHAIGNIVNAVKDAYGWFGKLAGAADSALGGIPGKILSHLGGTFGLASGGVAAAASGGPRSGWTLVGELGPELVRIPPGTQVMNHAQTAGMLGGAGGGGEITIRLVLSGSDSKFMDALAGQIRVKGGDPRILTRKVRLA